MEEQGKTDIPTVKINRKKENGRLKGPLRLTRLCILGILLPGLLIAGPMYLRYRVYLGQVYPLGMTDMRLVDNRISTTWCQRQLVKSNATFNAYLLPDVPQMKPNPVRMSMVRKLDLRDDMKEYWGFYLLKGSSFTVSTCCRWPGALLTVIRGHKHLRECAYFGDDSSEEEDELDRAEADGGKRKDEDDDGMSNEPSMMKKARPGVVFHGSQERNTHGSHRLSKEIVGDNGNDLPDEWTPVRAGKRGRGGGRGWVAPAARGPGNGTESEEEVDLVYREVLDKIRGLGARGKNMLLKLNENLNGEANESAKRKAEAKRDTTQQQNMQKEFNKDDKEYDAAEEEGDEEEEENLMYEDLRGTFNETTHGDRSESEFWSSFSSSEERLINCSGLIVNLPLTPRKGCQAKESEESQANASLANKFTYTVPANGYYFFVFSSENEIQPNYIRVHFHFEKMIYNVSNPVAECKNTTHSCSLPLNFFSWEKTVLEMPLFNNDSLWNQEFVVVSVCEPRTVVYAACVIAVPVLILLFAF